MVDLIEFLLFRLHFGWIQFQFEFEKLKEWGIFIIGAVRVMHWCSAGRWFQCLWVKRIKKMDDAMIVASWTQKKEYHYLHLLVGSFECQSWEGPPDHQEGGILLILSEHGSRYIRNDGPDRPPTQCNPPSLSCWLSPVPTITVLRVRRGGVSTIWHTAGLVSYYGGIARPRNEIKNDVYDCTLPPAVSPAPALPNNFVGSSLGRSPLVWPMIIIRIALPLFQNNKKNRPSVWMQLELYFLSLLYN